MTLKIDGITTGTYIVDLMDEKIAKVHRSYTIEKNCSLLFPYLKAGKYCIRITEDANKNGLLDTGSLLERRQAEKVRLYKLQNGESIFELKEKTDIEQDVNIQTLFSDAPKHSADSTAVLP